MTATCPACDAPVFEARDFTGATILLNPRPSPAGKLAVQETRDGTLHARLITPADPVRDEESRHQPHTCAGRSGGLGEVRAEQSRQAAAARNRRGRWKPKGRSPFGGASGVRVLPPGGDAA